jgi:hypothetical protein
MADEFEARTFVGNPNPAPDFSKVRVSTPAPQAEQPSAPSAPAAPAESEPAATKSPGVYTVATDSEGRRAVYLSTDDLQTNKLGFISIPDADTVLNQAGKFNETDKSWEVPQDIALSLLKGKQPLPEFIRQQYQAGDATVLRGLWGKRFLSGESGYNDAAAHANAERLKMVANERPDIAWGEAPFSRAVAEMRWAAGEAAKLAPFMTGAAEESAGGAAIAGAIGLAGAVAIGSGGAAVALPAMLGGSFAVPAAAAAVAGMMSTGAAYNTFRYVMDIEGGNLALDMMEKGFDEKTVRAAAPAYGALSAALELVGFKFLTAPAKRAMSRTVLGSAPVKKILTSWYMNYAKELGAEVSVEVAQQATEDTISNFAALVDKRADLMTSKEEMMKAMSDTALASFAGLAVIKLPGVATDFAGARAQRSNARVAKAAITSGELDAKTVTAAQLEKTIMGAEPGPTIEAKKINEILGAGKDTTKAMFDFGKKNVGNDDVKAALSAKVAALNLKREAILDGKEIADLTPEQQTELVPVLHELNALNEMGRGMEEGVKLSAKQAEEPMVPLKEPKTPAEAVERRYAEQGAVLRTLDKESRALDAELTDINDDITTRMSEGKPTAALANAASKVAAKIRENDALAAEIVMTPIHFLDTAGEETVRQSLLDAGVEATLPVAELVRMENDLISRVQQAAEAGRRHGAAYAKREVARVQAYIQELVKRSSITDAQKAKFMAVMRNTKTVEQLEKNYPEIRDRIFEAEAVNREKALAALLKRELKSAKPKVVNGKRTGRFGDADTQAIMDTVTRVIRMARKDAALESVAAEQALLEASDESAPGYTPEKHALAEYRYRASRYRAGDISSKEAAAFVSDLVAMAEGAKAKFLEKRLAEREARLAKEKAATGNVLGEVKPPEGWQKFKVESGAWVKGLKVPHALTGLWTKAFDSLQSIGDLLAFRSGERKGESAIEKMLDTSREADHERGFLLRWGERLNAGMDRAYGIEGKDGQRARARRRMERRLMQSFDLGVHENAAGQKVHLVFTIDEAVKRFMERQDPTLAENFTHPDALAYTPAMEAEIFGLLTEADKRFALEQLQVYRELHKAVNAVYRKIRGIDLPFNEFYSPIRALGYAEKEGVEVAFDPAATQLHAKSTLGGWSISRVRHVHPLEQLGALTTMNEHIRQLGHYVAWEAKVRELNSLLANGEFKAAVTGVYGDEVLAAMKKIVERITSGRREQAIMRAGEAFITRLMTANVAGKPIMIAKQLTSLPAFASGVPAEDLFFFFAHAAKQMKEGFSKEWLNSEFVRSRGWNQFEELQALADLGKKGTRADKVAAVAAEALAQPIKVGDRVSILIGGDALYRYHRAKGRSVAEAVELASKVARETQSSGSISDLSVFQSMGGATRLFTAYRNQPIQFLRMEMSALRAIASKGFFKGEGRMTRLDVVKTLFIYHFVIPSLFQAIVDLGWDEEHQKRAWTFGSFNDLPIIADLTANLYSIIAGEEGGVKKSNNVIDSWTDDILKASKEFLVALDTGDLEDFVVAFKLLADPAFKAMWGIPAKPIINTAEGIKTIASGDSEDFVDALKLIVGYTPRAIEEQGRR